MSGAEPVESITSIANIRDVGRTVNQFLQRRLVKEGLIYRSARPDDATPKDEETVRVDLGIKTILDLRTKTERLNQARKQEANPDGADVAQGQVDAVLPIRIPGVRYELVSLTGKGLERFLVSQLSWWSYLRVLICMLFGWRVEAMGIIASEVMKPKGLIGFGLDMVDHSGHEIATALRSYIEPAGVPSLVHCTQGKDRTGLIVALVLMILDVPVAAIENDYVESEKGLEKFATTRLAEISRIGLTKEWGKVDPKMITALDEHLSKRYGGVDDYLDTIGFVEKEREQMRELLLY